MSAGNHCQLSVTFMITSFEIKGAVMCETQGQQSALSDNPLLFALCLLEVTRGPLSRAALESQNLSFSLSANSLEGKSPPRAIWGHSVVLLLFSRGGLPFSDPPVSACPSFLSLVIGHSHSEAADTLPVWPRS